MGVAGPLPEGIVGLVLGRSSLSEKKKKKEKRKISVVHGVVDSDYIEKLKFWPHRLLKLQINKGQRITQFLLLPYQTGKNLTSQAKSHRAFRSSDLAFWVQEITAPRPLKDLLIQENKMSGLLDTETDVS